MNNASLHTLDVGWGDSLLASWSGTAAHADASDDVATAAAAMRSEPESLRSSMAGIYWPGGKLSSKGQKPLSDFARVALLVGAVFVAALAWRELGRS